MPSRWTTALALLVCCGLGVWALLAYSASPGPLTPAGQEAGIPAGDDALSIPSTGEEGDGGVAAHGRLPTSAAAAGLVRVRGLVVDDRGVARAGVTVQAMQEKDVVPLVSVDFLAADPLPISTGATDENGRYELRVPATLERLRIRATVSAKARRSYTTPGFAVTAVPVTAPVLTVPREAEVELYLRSTAGQPIEGVMLRVLFLDLDLDLDITDDAGRARFRFELPAPAGPASEAAVTARPYEPLRVEVEAKAPFPRHSIFTLAPLVPGPQQRFLTLSEGLAVELRFHETDGRELHGGELRIVPQDAAGLHAALPVEARVPDQGWPRLHLVPGHYTVLHRRERSWPTPVDGFDLQVLGPVVQDYTVPEVPGVEIQLVDAQGRNLVGSCRPEIVLAQQYWDADEGAWRDAAGRARTTPAEDAGDFVEKHGWELRNCTLIESKVLLFDLSPNTYRIAARIPGRGLAGELRFDAPGTGSRARYVLRLGTLEPEAREPIGR